MNHENKPLIDHRPSVFAVLDVGKTNKKALLYNQGLEILESESWSCSPYEKEGYGGNVLEWESIDGILEGFISRLEIWSHDYKIESIALSAHGGTLACLDEHGEEIDGVLSYTSSLPQSFFETFDREVMESEVLHELSSSPDVGFVNLVRQIFAMEHFEPEAWARTQSILPLSTYLAYRLSGNMFNEISYIGNHSGLWDHRQGGWNEVARSRGYGVKFPPFRSAWELCGELSPIWRERLQVDGAVDVLVGVHDSNAALLPYLIASSEKTVLFTTGTWCLGMAPCEEVSLSKEDIQSGSYHNIDVFGRPVKTVGFTGGHEYEKWSSCLSLNDVSVSVEDYEFVFGLRTFVVPGLMGGSVFPNCSPGIYIEGDFVPYAELEKKESADLGLSGSQRAALLDVSLAIQSMLSIKGSLLGAKKVIVEGGFVNNKNLLGLLAALLPTADVLTSTLSQASAFGAACCALAHSKGASPMHLSGEIELPLSKVKALELNGLGAYVSAFLNQLSKVA